MCTTRRKNLQHNLMTGYSLADEASGKVRIFISAIDMISVEI